MYQCKLAIRVYSREPFLLRELQQIPPLERFEHEFGLYSEFVPDKAQEADVAILDLPAVPSGLRAQCKHGAVLVRCVAQERLADLAASVYEEADDIWISPFDAAFVGFRFRKLLELIKLRKDDRLHQIYLDTAIDSIPDLVWFKDLCGAHLKVNNGFCQAVGKTKEDVQGRGHYYIWDLKKEEYEKGEYVCLETEEMVLQARKTCQFDEKVKSKHGMRQFKTYKSPLLDDDGQIMGTVGIAHDVTDLENMDAELEIILRSMPFAILVSDGSGSIIKVNAKFEEYFRVKGSEVIGQQYSTWKSFALKDATGVNGEGYMEAVLHLDDENRIIEVREEQIFDIFHNQVGQLCICRDVSVERMLKEQMLRNANTDALTGLYNRRYFYEYVDANRGDRPLGLLYVDLDNFKGINDNYGHQVGDEALVAVAALIRESFPDALCARVGGDEFLIALIGESRTEVLEERTALFLRRMREAFQHLEKTRDLTASVGIALTAEPHMSVDTLIRLSDIALYASKAAGKSRHCVYSSGLQSGRRGLGRPSGLQQ